MSRISNTAVPQEYGRFREANVELEKLIKEPNASQFFTDKDKATKEQLEAFENAVLGAQAIRKGVKTARKTAGMYNQYYRQMNSGGK